MRFLFLTFILMLSSESYTSMPDPKVGLPELATEEEIAQSQKKRSKVFSQSVQRKITRVVEALDEAGILEDEKAYL